MKLKTWYFLKLLLGKCNSIPKAREAKSSVHWTFLERIGSVAYHLKFLRDLERIHDVFHVSMLRKYISNPSHVLETPPVELKEDLSFEVQLVGILDHREKVLRNKVVPMIKVLWRSDKVEEMM